MIEKGGIYKLKKIKDFFGNNTEDDFQVLKVMDDTVYCKNLTTDEVFMVNKNDLIDPEYPDDIYSNFEIIQEREYKMSIKKLIEQLENVLNEQSDRYLSVEPIEGGFIPNTDIEYNAEIVLYDGENRVDSIMIPLDYFGIKGDEDKYIRDIAKDHFDNITDDIKVSWY